MGVPIVSTHIGAEGLPVKDGTHLMLRDSPEQFADAVSELLRQDQRRLDLASHAQRLVRERYGWQPAATAFVAHCEDVVAHRSVASTTRRSSAS